MQFASRLLGNVTGGKGALRRLVRHRGSHRPLVCISRENMRLSALKQDDELQLLFNVHGVKRTRGTMKISNIC